MLPREVIAVYSEIRTKHINTVLEYKEGYLNIELGGS
jgi:hypothetical protein